MRARMVLAGVAMAASLSGCVTPNDEAMKIGAAPGMMEGTTTVGLRSLQTRRFDTGEEVKILLAATQTLQDLGFTITESSADVGVLVASKQRDAEESGQIAGQVALTVLAAALGTYHQPTWDREQSIFVTLITSPLGNAQASEVRVSFDRRITNNYGQMWRTELILEPSIYQDFFSKLAEGVFLEAHTV